MKKRLFSVFICLFMFPAVVSAHKVIVFAWVEDGMIHTQSSFGSKRKAKNCTITLQDEHQIILDQGTTDFEGLYTFEMPKEVSSDVTVFLDAGSGHQASWTIPKGELNSDMQENTDQKKQDVQKEREKIDEPPSLLQIMTGIGVIFILALSLKLFQYYFKKRKNIND